MLTDSALMANCSGYALSDGAVLKARAATASLPLTSGQTLSGDDSGPGTLSLGDGATLAPGDAIGMLASGGARSFFPLAATVMEVIKPPLTKDQISAQSVVFDGSLVVNHSGTAPVTGGEVFKLFSAVTSAGAFASVSLSVLNDGLFWNTARLDVDGTISVSRTNPPPMTGWSVVGTNLVLSAGGTS